MTAGVAVIAGASSGIGGTDALDTGARGGPDSQPITLVQHGFAIAEADEREGATR
jgi:hypothetical protein